MPHPTSPDLAPTLAVSFADGLDRVDADAWDALGSRDDPFTEHAFLRLLEDGGAVGAEAGWQPQHVLVHQDGPDGPLVGAMPLYVKNHSYGEYIFDWGWADAAHRAGLRYYPKLVSAVPFTPASGSRLRLHPSLDAPAAARVQQALVGGALHLAKAVDASSLHVLFCEQAERQAMEGMGLIGRKTFQFHWENQGYGSFEDWLSTFRSRRRKETRRERRLPAGVQVRELAGDALSPAQQRAVRNFYEDTCHKRGGHPYLTPDSFSLLWSRLAHRLTVLLAEAEGQTVAMSLLFHRGAHLYGRYWGCRPGFEGLHFELCYHRPIELCIERGLRRFEAGAQGTHKIKRGLLPAPTWSAHWLAHPGLRRAVASACADEARGAEQQMAALARHGPAHRGEDEPGDLPAALPFEEG